MTDWTTEQRNCLHPRLSSCCPRYGGYEWCVVARGTEPFLFRRDVCGVEVESRPQESVPKLTVAQRTFLQSIVRAVAGGYRGVMAGKRQVKMANTLAIRGLVEVVDSVRANGEDLHVYALTPAAMQALLDMSEGGEEA